MGGQLEGRVALVTGANRGIGLAIAREYAREGAQCLIAGRNVAALEKVAASINGAGGKAKAIPMDLEDDASIRSAIAQVARLTPRLDIFVANAAALGARVAITKYPIDVWRQTFQVNVHANLLLLQGLHRLRLDRRRRAVLPEHLELTQACGKDFHRGFRVLLSRYQVVIGRGVTKSVAANTES